MIFQHTLSKVLSGEKTQTRRLCAPEPNGESVAGFEMLAYPEGKLAVVRGTWDDSHWVTKWQVGKDYAVQPGRKQKAVARIRITDIRREDVREISDEDVKAEGFGCDKDAFLEVWCEMHDKEILPMYTAMYRQGWLTTQPAERYQAWALTFELVQP